MFEVCQNGPAEQSCMGDLLMSIMTDQIAQPLSHVSIIWPIEKVTNSNEFYKIALEKIRVKRGHPENSPGKNLE